jgi:hypothetical protein
MAEPSYAAGDASTAPHEGLAMDVMTFTITVVCLIEDWLASQSRPLRGRGPAPTLSDSEFLTIECVGELLGIDTTAACTSTTAATGPTGSRPCAGCTTPPSSARPQAVGRQAPPPPAPAGQVDFDPPSRWSTAWPCRSAGSHGPSRCRRPRGWQPGPTTRPPSNPTSAAPTCGCAGPG